VGSTPWAGPRASVAALAEARGRDAVVTGCLDLLAGKEPDAELVVGLAGPAARWGLDAGPDYWFRVWALRGLLWLWDERATDAVARAMDDDAWRVREMAAKVAARHRVDAALEQLVRLQDDPVARVRSAADRALRLLAG
jgi:hypothetical protein